jgi:hypothetical protein
MVLVLQSGVDVRDGFLGVIEMRRSTRFTCMTNVTCY